MSRPTAHVSLRGAPGRTPTGRGRSALGQSAGELWFYVDMVALMDIPNNFPWAVNLQDAAWAITGLVAEEGAAALTEEGADVEVVDPVSEIPWKILKVHDELSNQDARSIAESFFQEVENSAQGEDNENYVIDVLNNIKRSGGLQVPLEADEEFIGPVTGNFVFYRSTLPFLHFTNVASGNGNGGGNGGAEWFEPYPCQVTSDGDILIGALPNGLIGNGAEVTVEMYGDLVPPDPGNGDDNDDDDHDDGDEPPDPILEGDVPPSSTLGAQFDEVSTRVDYVEEADTGYRVVACADLTPYASYQAGLTVDTIGAPGCGAPPPGNGNSGNGNGGNGGGNGNGGNDPDDEDDTEEGPAPVSAAAVGAVLAASVGAGYLLSQ